MTRPRRDPTGGQADALRHLDRVLDPVSLAVAISKLPPNHALVAATRAGADVADARWEHREQLRQAGKDIAAGLHHSWQRRAHDHLPHEELERRRAEIPQQRLPDLIPISPQRSPWPRPHARPRRSASPAELNRPATTRRTIYPARNRSCEADAVGLDQ